MSPDVMVAALLVGLAALQMPQPQPAAPPESFDDGAFTAFSAMHENDVLWQLGHNQDRNYTGGFGFVASGSFIDRFKLNALLNGVDQIFQVNRLHTQWDHHYHSMQLFGTGFTPDMLNAREVVPDDRPYASLVGLSWRKLSVDDGNRDQAWTSELSVAFLGLDLAGDIQTKLHRRLRKRSGELTPYDPLGWHNQISHGGEFTALYAVGYERRLAGAPAGPNDGRRKHFQASWGATGSVGYYTNLTGSLSARLGVFDSDFWEFQPSVMGHANQTLGTGKRHRNPRWEWFVFGSVRPRGIGYNVLLQGQQKESIHTVDPKRTQVEFHAGLAVSIPAVRTQVVWNAYAGRTSEMHVGPSRTHTWGSLMVTFAPRFK